MAKSARIPQVCAFKLNETYDTLYELQDKLGVSDEYLFEKSKEELQDEDRTVELQKLLEASKLTRDNLITWYLKQTLVELNVTISLLTAKIKFIEYKLGLCEGIDLHQACSLALVNFCNILADMTVLNVNPSERKTLHTVSNEVDIPIWLSHYRNQICHMPSESPCISVLVPLVVKSLNYMKDSFWSKVLKRDTFDAIKCRKLVRAIGNLTDLTSINQHLEVRKDIDISKKRIKLAQRDLVKSTKACALLRRFLLHNPGLTLDLIIEYIINYPPKRTSCPKNCALLIEQVILARCFEKFVNKIVEVVKEKPGKNVISWLQRVTSLMSLREKTSIKKSFARMGMNWSVKLRRLTEVPPLKCCHIAHKIIQIDNPVVRLIVPRMRNKLKPILGKQRTLLLIKLTKIAKRSK